MNIYVQTEEGTYTFNGMSIPNTPGNRHYDKMQAEVVAGTGSITSFVLSLDEVKTRRKEYINTCRDDAMNAGVLYGGNTYDTDRASRDNLTGVHSGINDGWTLPLGFTWRTSDNLDIPFTAIQVNGLAHAMLDHVNNQYGNSWAKKAAIDAVADTGDLAADTAAVNAIDW